ncbi:kinase-like domain-containing protein [Chytriomyces cf. hyalinus JEL632]|nr:kinase-like domain-containing protein [Chytriomyces cf. hyalinus JEL632]
MGPRSFSVSSQYKGVNNKLVKAQDKQGTKLINQYTVIREIGRGVHGKVKVAEDTEEGGLWAIKIVDKHAKKRFQSRFAFSQSLQNQRINSATSQSSNNPNSTSISSNTPTSATLSSTLDAMNNLQLEKIKREIAILKKIDHANVVGLREVIDDPEAAKIYLVLEYMAGGEVEWRDLSCDPPRPVMGVSDARRILRDVLRGLEYLHHNGIIHRDIKPANLLWDSQKENVKISDFGVSVFIDVTSQDTAAVQMELAKTAGSPAFFAPELCAAAKPIARHKSPMKIGAAIDVWALGVTLFCLVFGRVPFVAETEFELFHVICKAPLVFPSDPTIDDQLKDLLVKMLDKNPETRIRIPEIKVKIYCVFIISDHCRTIAGAWMGDSRSRECTASEMEFGSRFNVWNTPDCY